MLRFTSLTIEDFGPFKGRQTIDFTDKDGVTIIWGNNGRGKTTLLNVFRFALFSKVQGRQGEIKDLLLLCNSESRSEGKYGFKVVLGMDVDGIHYELTRQYTLKSGVTIPARNDDFEEKHFLKENTSILSGAQCDHLLKSIMPQEVSRFFLFDGELLQEYEELLADDATAGAKIKDSIEQILGVPVLTNGSVDVQSVLDEYKRAKNKTAQEDIRTQKIASQISALEAKCTEHQAEYNRLRDELREQCAAKSKIEGELDQEDKVRGLISDAKAEEISIAEKKSRKDGLLSSIVAVTKDAWKALINPCVSKVLAKVDDRIHELELRANTQITTRQFIDEMHQAITNKHCVLCDQDIGDKLLQKMQDRISSAESEFGGLTAEEKAELAHLRLQHASLSEMLFPSCKGQLQIYEKQLAELIVDIGRAERRLSTVRDDIAKYGDVGGVTERIQKLISDLSVSNAKITNLEEGKKAESDIIEDTKRSITTLDAQLNRLAHGKELDDAKRRVELCEEIHSIFEQGISAYRDKLKSDVERDATDLFVKIRNDPDYISLKINDNYGLSIVHRSGKEVPLRSAGYEHIVALALIAALHKNAPLRGPIIMDSPFGRLDPGHKDKITQNLPAMSEQIILLVYTHEIDEQIARSTLGNALRNEYMLDRISSFHTEIKPQTN